MILINSIHGEVSTDQVMRWLYGAQTEVIRLNDEVKVKAISYENGCFCLQLMDSQQVDLSNLTGYWYRRGHFRMQAAQLEVGEESFDHKYQDYIGHEQQSVMDFFLHHLKTQIPHIGDSQSCMDVNKHIVLQEAQAMGLQVPQQIITGNKRAVGTFLQEHGRIITKPLHGSFTYHNDEYWYPTYTEEVTQEMLADMPEQFQPSLFQAWIPKKVEIRSFYLLGEVYSMAIFSQNDDQTATDFRKYNDDRPNRTVPFRLPADLEKSYCLLMEKLGFESGSADFIYTPDKEFYFLEINPVGQFGMVSGPCNYPLEKRIAEHLCQSKII